MRGGEDGPVVRPLAWDHCSDAVICDDHEVSLMHDNAIFACEYESIRKHKSHVSCT